MCTSDIIGGIGSGSSRVRGRGSSFTGLLFECRAMRDMAADCLSKIKLDPAREAELREGFSLLDRDNSG